MVALDLSKAFDRTWRTNIVDKIRSWDIRGNMLTCIRNFLGDRVFRVAIGSTLSQLRVQENGIPQ